MVQLEWCKNKETIIVPSTPNVREFLHSCDCKNTCLSRLVRMVWIQQTFMLESLGGSKYIVTMSYKDKEKGQSDHTRFSR